MRLIINIDGGSRGNPGPSGAGIVVQSDDGIVLMQRGVFIGKATNNVAEYTGLVEALKSAAELNAAEVQILSDSELLVKQMTGVYRVKNANLKSLFEKAKSLAGEFDTVSFKHVRRELNTAADKLANRAMNLKSNFSDTDTEI